VVAVKVLTHGPRYAREMEANGKLEHKNIVRAEHADSIGDVHYIVTEYVDGVNLSQASRSGEPMSVADACEVAYYVAEALRHMHREGLVHRDIKPSNVMLSRQGDVKLLDLGLAHFSDPDPADDHVTAVGQILGTLGFMAPEQIAGETVSAATDVYSLGCTLYAILAGDPPFVGDRRDVIRGHVAELPAALTAVRKDVPRAVSDLVARLLAKEPG
jgi:eukaryotic-like serine/threonine-protein kinase